jgi:hypothetical protein
VVTPISIAKCARTKRIAAVMPVRSITEDGIECDGADGFTENLGQNPSRNDIAAKLSVMLSNFYVHSIERISISRSLIDGRAKGHA